MNRKQSSTFSWGWKTGLTAGLICLAAIFLLSACSSPPTPAPTADVASIQTQAAQTVVADLTEAAPLPPTATPQPTESPQAPGPTPDTGAPVAMLPTPAAGQPLAVANYNTYIYSGPGEDYIVYGAFLGGRTALVIGKSEDGGWWAVSVPLAQGGAGWVDTDWVTVTNAGSVPVLPTPPVPPVATIPQPGADDPQVKAMVNTAVRSGPGNNYPAYGIAPAGKSGTVLGKSQDSQWWVVRIDPTLVGAGYGWIAAAYVEAENVSSVPGDCCAGSACSGSAAHPGSGQRHSHRGGVR